MERLAGHRRLAGGVRPGADPESDPAVSPLAVVHPSARLGPGTVVHPFASIGMNVETGPHCAIGSTVYLGHHVRLGESVRIQHGAFVPNRTHIGDRVFIGPNATLTDDRYPRVNNPHYRARPPIVEDDVAIGAGAVILPGIRLGQGALVGAGAVVTEDVAPWSVVAGNPARPMLRPRPDLPDLPA